MAFDNPAQLGRRNEVQGRRDEVQHELSRKPPKGFGTIGSARPLNARHRENIMATETRETIGLIGSDKVEGTAVYGADDEKIGSIERVMLGKTDGRVAYAMLSCGGFLGFGDDHYPLPWQQLTYDTDVGGYRVNLTKDQLEGAPKYSGDAWDWEDRASARQVSDYYGTPWVGY
jgi:hypothetical protein